MQKVETREFKAVDLGGATLVVSVPHVGQGSLVLTDHILEEFDMDHVAAFDATDFPALAMIRRGKARFPLRVHAEARAGLAVLRSEFPPPGRLVRPLARAVLDWTARRGIQRVLALDGLHGLGPAAGGRAPDHLWFAASSGPAAAWAQSGGLQDLPEGVLGGVPAALVLEGRMRAADVVVGLAELREPADEARSVMGFALAIHRLVPRVPLDLERLERDLAEVEASVRELRQRAEKALRHVEEPTANAPMYG